MFMNSMKGNGFSRLARVTVSASAQMEGYPGTQKRRNRTVLEGSLHSRGIDAPREGASADFFSSLLLFVASFLLGFF